MAKDTSIPFSNPLTEQPVETPTAAGATPLPAGYITTASGRIYRADYERGVYVEASKDDLEKHAPLDVASPGAPPDVAQQLNGGPVDASFVGKAERKAVEESPSNKAVDQTPDNK